MLEAAAERGRGKALLGPVTPPSLGRGLTQDMAALLQRDVSVPE